MEGGSVIKNSSLCSENPFIRSIGEAFQKALESKVETTLHIVHQTPNASNTTQTNITIVQELTKKDPT